MDSARRNSPSIEEVSSDESRIQPQSWAGYTWGLAAKVGGGVMKVVYFLGEKLSYGLGISTPDWQYAIDIHEDLLREEREEKEAEELALKKQREEILEALKQMEEESAGSQVAEQSPKE